MQSDPNADAAVDGVAPGEEGLGRRIMLAVGASVVAISGGIGWIVGSNGAVVASEVSVLGTGVTLPVTPAAIALYGIVVSGGLLALLFGLVEVASRIERDDNSANSDSRR